MLNLNHGRSLVHLHCFGMHGRLIASATALAAFLLAPVSSAASSLPSAVTFGGTAVVGALFTTTANGKLASHFCTGSVVDSPADDVVVTTAHCVTDRSTNRMAFVSGYADGRALYRIWSVSRVIVNKAWLSTADSDGDVAFLVVTEPKSTASVQRVIGGGEHLSIGQSCGEIVKVIGYPDAKNAPVRCKNVLVSFSSTQLEFGCGGHTTGASGDPARQRQRVGNGC